MFQQPPLNKPYIIIRELVLDLVLAKYIFSAPIRRLNTAVGTKILPGSFGFFVFYGLNPDMVMECMYCKSTGFASTDTSGEFPGFVQFADPPEGRKIRYVCDHISLSQSIAGSSTLPAFK